MPTLLQLNRKVDYIGSKFERLRELVCKMEGGGSVVETDPVFENSPASSITEENINTWNSNSDSEPTFSNQGFTI